MKVFEDTKKRLSPHKMVFLIVFLMFVSSVCAQVGAASTDLVAIQGKVSDVSKLVVNIIKGVIFAGCAIFFGINIYAALVSKKPGALANAIFIAVGAVAFGNIGTVLQWILPDAWFKSGTGGYTFIQYF